MPQPTEDGYQVLQTASSPEGLSETDWTVFDKEAANPDSPNPDQGDATGDTPLGDTQQREESQKPALTSRARLMQEDYEMQLRLLEAQNKRRLEMARQEQAKLGIPSSQTQTPMKGPPQPNSAAVMNPMQGNPTMAIRNRMGTMPPSVKPPNQPDPMVFMLQAQIKALQDENQHLRRQLLETKGANFAIFYCITGEERDEVYLDKPRWVRRGEKLVLEADSPVQYPEAYGLYRSLHFVVYKNYSAKIRAGTGKTLQQDIGGEMPDPEPHSEIIKLVSEEMKRAMEKVAEIDEAIQKRFPCLISGKELRAPGLWWYYYRNRRDVLDGLTPSQAEAMQSLMRWLDEAYSKVHSRADSQFKHGMASASSLGYLIQPGDVLVRRVEGGIEAYLATSWLQKVTPSPSTQDPDEVPPPFAYEKKSDQRWEVDAWSYGYDGDFYRLMKKLEVQLDADITRDAELSIADLNVFPLRFASQELRETLERRGKTFWSCRHGKYISYGNEAKDKSHAEQRYMIDCRTYKNTHPAAEFVRNVAHKEEVLCEVKVESTFIDQEDALSGPDMYLFPRIVNGYDLRRKKWDEVNVDLIREIPWNKNALAHLVAEPETKELIQAVITSHILPQTEAGVIQSKDNSLAILLRGDPGTGKTLTAESVAEVVERPLYVVRCSEMGTKPEDVEKGLDCVFHLAKAWGCIVLLDEAEVFLEQRRFNDVARSALVSAFLRALECYDGILILESNRLGSLDAAFQSRIQIALHHDPLTAPQRSQIWRNLFNNLKSFDKDETEFDDVDGYVDELSKRQLNGHQMRNILTTARELARFQGKAMTADHLKSVVKLI